MPGKKPEEHGRTGCSATAGSGQEGEPRCQEEEIRGLTAAGRHGSFLIRGEILPGKPLAAGWSLLLSGETQPVGGEEAETKQKTLVVNRVEVGEAWDRIQLE